MWSAHPSEHGGGALAALAAGFGGAPAAGSDTRSPDSGYPQAGAAEPGVAEGAASYQARSLKYLGAFQDTYLVVETDPPGYVSTEDSDGGNDNQVAVTLEEWAAATRAAA